MPTASFAKDLMPSSPHSRRFAGFFNSLRSCFGVSCLSQVETLPQSPSRAPADREAMPAHLQSVQPALRKTVAPAGLGLTDLAGTHKLFDSKTQQLSPVFAMIYANNGLLEACFDQGQSADVDGLKVGEREDLSQEKAGTGEARVDRMALASALFSVLPGGDIAPTHQAKNVASHFNASLLGKLVALVATGPALSASSSSRTITQRVKAVIEGDADYQASIAKARGEVSELKAARAALLERNEQEQSLVAEKQKIQKEVARLKRDIKQLEKGKGAQENAAARKTDLQMQIQSREEKLKAFPAALLSKGELKSQLRKLDYQIATQDTESPEYEAQLESFSALLGRMSSESSGAAGDAIPLLQVLFWRNARDTSDLVDYLSALNDAQLLNPKSWPKVRDRLLGASTAQGAGKVSLESVSAAKQNKLVGQFPFAWNKSGFVTKRLDTALAVLMAGGKEKAVAPVVPFSYVRWATYSSFPDCGENALRNVFNQLLYDPQNKCFDPQRLVQLKNTTLPNMSDKLIDFYRKHSSLENMLDKSAAKDWLATVSDLNARDLPCEPVHYRKDGRTHVASPMHNLERVVARLTGIESDKPMEAFVSLLAAATDREMSVDRSGVCEAGFGNQVLSVGGSRFVLSAFKPIHFGFFKEGSEPEGDADLNRAISQAIIRGAQHRFARADNESARQASLAALTLFETSAVDAKQ